MFNKNTLDNLSFCSVVKYTNNKNYLCDYSTSPRPCHNFVFMLEGEGIIYSEGKEIRLKKGDILYIPQNSTYLSNWKATPKNCFHSVHFKFSLSQDPFFNKAIPVQLLPNDEFENLYKLVLEMQRYQYSSSPESYFYLSAFYSLCARLLPHAKQITERELPTGNIAPALSYLEKHFIEHCSISKLAKLCFLSESRFYYLFKKQTGCSPIVYKNKITIQHAAQALLLHKEASVEKIAYEFGFESPIYFRRLFKNILGKTPSEYRKEEKLI